MELRINLLQLRIRDVDLSLNEYVDDFLLTMCFYSYNYVEYKKNFADLFQNIFMFN